MTTNDTASRAFAEETASVDIPAYEIRPGDYLPPQRALHGTRWRASGFSVGERAEDVKVDLPVLSGKVLLFGAPGLLDSIPRRAVVTVRRNR